MNVFFLGLALLVFSYVATEFTYGTPQKVALDFGLGVLSLSAVGIAIFIGVNIVNKEIESRTIYIILSQPLKRQSFLIGRLLGMTLLLFLNTLILSVLTLAIYFAYGGDFQPLFLWSILFSFLEAVIVLNISVFFSLITNITMSVVYTIIIFIMGHATSAVLEITEKGAFMAYHSFIKVISFFIPNLSKINIKNFVLYQPSMELEFLISSLLYSAGWILLLIFISSIMFKNKELN